MGTDNIIYNCVKFSDFIKIFASDGLITDNTQQQKKTKIDKAI